MAQHPSRVFPELPPWANLRHYAFRMPDGRLCYDAKRAIEAKRAGLDVRPFALRIGPAIQQWVYSERL